MTRGTNFFWLDTKSRGSLTSKMSVYASFSWVSLLIIDLVWHSSFPWTSPFLILMKINQLEIARQTNIIRWLFFSQMIHSATDSSFLALLSYFSFFDPWMMRLFMSTVHLDEAWRSGQQAVASLWKMISSIQYKWLIRWQQVGTYASAVLYRRWSDLPTASHDVRLLSAFTMQNFCLSCSASCWNVR